MNHSSLRIIIGFLILIGFISCQPKQESTAAQSIAYRLPAPGLKRLSQDQFGIDVASRKVLQST
ncbi:MAG: hypothetical protein AAF206_31955, partial [Bacteroidota bacterium]